MMRGKVWVLAAGAMFAVACGDDDPSRPDEPDLTRADVAGQYEMTQLAFDPQGSLPEVDLLARIEDANIPRLFVASDEDSLRLSFVDPEGGLPRLVPGSFDLNDEGFTYTLANAIEPGQILLPASLALTFDSVTERLSFSGSQLADTTRLFVLVPEWSGEPVTNPLPGTLKVTFSRD